MCLIGSLETRIHVCLVEFAKKGIFYSLVLPIKVTAGVQLKAQTVVCNSLIVHKMLMKKWTCY